MAQDEQKANEKTEAQEDRELREKILKDRDVQDVQRFIGNRENIRTAEDRKTGPDKK